MGAKAFKRMSFYYAAIAMSYVFFSLFSFLEYTTMEKMGAEPLNEVCVCLRRKEHEITEMVLVTHMDGMKTGALIRGCKYDHNSFCKTYIGDLFVISVNLVVISACLVALISKKNSGEKDWLIAHGAAARICKLESQTKLIDDRMRQDKVGWR
jgi:hypothetical protein